PRNFAKQSQGPPMLSPILGSETASRRMPRPASPLGSPQTVRPCRVASARQWTLSLEHLAVPKRTEAEIHRGRVERAEPKAVAPWPFEWTARPLDLVSTRHGSQRIDLAMPVEEGVVCFPAGETAIARYSEL